jgi:hypothetical protein
VSDAIKHDQGKALVHLIDPLFINQLAAVLAFGAEKYKAWNWAKGTFDHSRLYNAAMRHLMAHWAGEDIDPESGLPHLAHAACNLMFLTRYVYSELGQDDRHVFRLDEPAITPANAA